jgi:hypothetical protein
MELENLAAALEELIESGAQNYGDGASITELHRLSSRLGSFITEATAAFEVGEEWAAEGAKTAASWISSQCQVSRAGAKARVRLGRTLRHLPQVAQAWRDGAIGEDQARAIASARRHRTEASMARDEALLVAQAHKLGFEDFVRVLEYWKQMADPDGADASEEEKKASRNVFLERSLGGMWLGQMTLDPISGSIVAGELNRLEHDLFEADCAEAKERLGRTGRIDELLRTSGQRRADALVEMATRSRSAPAEGTRPAPLFSVFVGYETADSRGPRKTLGSQRRLTKPRETAHGSPYDTGTTADGVPVAQGRANRQRGRSRRRDALHDGVSGARWVAHQRGSSGHVVSGCGAPDTG